MRFWCPCILFCSACFAPFASGQIGDRLDKPGMVQKSLVPKDEIPPAPVLSPEEALKSFTVAPGYRLELAASEPQVQEPVAVVFDGDGRMWVAEMRGYMPDVDGQGEDEPTGRISCLEDKDGDGFYEHATVFIDELVMPRALLRVADGLLVGAPPELAFYRDTDGDGKADEKQVVATDYGVKVDPERPHLANPERAPNSLLWGFDNWIYSAAYTRRFRYRDGECELGATSFRGQWGLTQDDYGRLYYGSNSDHIRMDVIDARYLSRQSHFPSLGGTNVKATKDQLVWPARVTPGINRGYRPEMLREGRLKEFTAAGGQWIYKGDRLPGLRGNYFVPEPGGNLVRRSVLTREGGMVNAENAYVESEFIASTDERFRPVNMATGPDGSLYVVDFYRGILQHRISLTSYLRDQILDRGLDKGLHLGRIYRVVADETTNVETTTKPESPAKWVPLLSHPNGWWRAEAQKELVALADPSTVDAIRAVATDGETAIGRVRALSTLEGIGDGALDFETVRAALKSDEALVQAHGVRQAEPWLTSDRQDELLSLLLPLASQGPEEVRLQAVLSVSAVTKEEVSVKLAELVREHGEQKYLLDAFLSGVMNRETSLLQTLCEREGWSPKDPMANRILAGLARGVMGSRNLEDVSMVVALAGEAIEKDQGYRAAALLTGLVPVSGSSRRPLVFESAPEQWSALADHASTKKAVASLMNTLVWPDKKGVTVVTDPPKLTDSQQELFDMGSTMYAAVCAACHQADGRGLEGLAPPLLDSEWVLGPSERPVRIVLHGVRGPIRVLGKTHTGDMPPLGVLPDDQIAAILTYVRRAWGHTASPVEPEEVARIRAATADHTDAWSPEELKQIP
ncbi:MAG: dehydrogenase [Verrucomicrobiales bacterium]|nr:dehydrogenase [Verrucomicrobiales bacterium]